MGNEMHSTSVEIWKEIFFIFMNIREMQIRVLFRQWTEFRIKTNIFITRPNCTSKIQLAHTLIQQRGWCRMWYNLLSQGKGWLFPVGSLLYERAHQYEGHPVPTQSHSGGPPPGWPCQSDSALVPHTGWWKVNQIWIIRLKQWSHFQCLDHWNFHL